ncbi:MAG: PrsW family glutamic-type intramembrane protease [Candidatus Paceibacterota bacterium]
MLSLLILSSLIGLAPIALWLVFFLWQDIKKPEPLRWLVILFFVGSLITPLVWFLENFFISKIGIDATSFLPLGFSLIIYLGIAIIEELAKFAAVAFILRGNRHFDEAIDAMIYLVVLALGFGTVENILIVFQEISSQQLILPILQITTLRFIGANLLHALSSGIIGFYWAISLVSGKKRYLTLGLFLGILLHWIFNTAIINLNSEVVYLASLILFIITIFILWAFDILKNIQKPINLNKKQ